MPKQLVIDDVPNNVYKTQEVVFLIFVSPYFW